MRRHFLKATACLAILTVGYVYFAHGRSDTTPSLSPKGSPFLSSGPPESVHEDVELGQLIPEYRVELSTEVDGGDVPLRSALTSTLIMANASNACAGCLLLWPRQAQVEMAAGGQALEGPMLAAARAQAERPFLLVPPHSDAALGSVKSRWRLRMHRSLVGEGEGSGVIGLLRQAAAFWVPPFVEPTEHRSATSTDAPSAPPLENAKARIRDEGTGGVRTFTLSTDSSSSAGLKSQCEVPMGHGMARAKLVADGKREPTNAVWIRGTREAQADQSRYAVEALAPSVFPFAVVSLAGEENYIVKLAEGITFAARGRVCITLARLGGAGDHTSAAEIANAITLISSSDDYLEVPLFSPRVERASAKPLLSPLDKEQIRRDVTPSSLRASWSESTLAADEELAKFTGLLVRRLQANPDFASELEAWALTLDPRGRRFLAALRALVSMGETHAQAALRNLADSLSGDVEKQVWMSLSNMPGADVSTGRWMRAVIEAPPKDEYMAGFVPLAAGSVAQRVASEDPELAQALTRRARATFLSQSSSLPEKIEALRALGNAALSTDAPLLLEALSRTRDQKFREALYDAMRMFTDAETFAALRDAAVDVGSPTAALAISTLAIRLEARSAVEEVSFVEDLVSRIDSAFETLKAKGSDVPLESVQLVATLRRRGILDAQDVTRLAASVRSDEYRRMLEN